MKNNKKNLFLLFLLFFLSFALLSCRDIKSPALEQGSPPTFAPALEQGIAPANVPDQEEVWLCYHPNTVHHNKLCVEDYYPNGCYVEGDNGKFCWRLHSEDCKEDNKEEWLFNACNFLGGHN